VTDVVRVDASGVALELSATPRRIVSLIPSTTELLCALGLAEALVGVTVYCVEPRDVVRGKTRVGGEKDPDIAAIRTLAPDLVVANVEENRREDVDALRAAGIPVWVTFPRTVAEGLAMIGDLGEVTGARAPARALLDALEPLYERARSRAARRAPVSVFYPIWRRPWMTIGGDTYVHDLLATCGGANVFADHTRYPTVTLDEMAAKAPDIILLPDEPFRFRRAHLADFDAYPAVPAVRGRRIHLVDGKLFSWHGPRLSDALTKLPDLLAGT
jgi:ABC-type Fe3+-hydroxamate transport system substrate-binding protein